MFHFFFLIWILLYFLPSIIGFQKHNAPAIIAVNVLLGWTVIGWFVALVWAVTAAPAVGGPWSQFSNWQTAGPWRQAPQQSYQPPYQPPYQAPYQPPQPQSPPQPQAPPAAQKTGAGFCSHCGSALRAGDRFCAGCGSGVPQA